MDKILNVQEETNSIIVDEETVTDLGVIASFLKKSRAEIVKEAVSTYLDRLVQDSTYDEGVALEKMFGRETTTLIGIVASNMNKSPMEIAINAMNIGLYGLTMDVLKERSKQKEHIH